MFKCFAFCSSLEVLLNQWDVHAELALENVCVLKYCSNTYFKNEIVYVDTLLSDITEKKDGFSYTSEVLQPVTIRV